MAEISNQRVIERYKDLLANRTHDVIVRDAAIEALEAEIKRLSTDIDAYKKEIAGLKGEPNTIPGEVIVHSTMGE